MQEKIIEEERDGIEIDNNSEHMLSEHCYVMVETFKLMWLSISGMS